MYSECDQTLGEASATNNVCAGGYSIYCSRTFGTLFGTISNGVHTVFWNDIKWSAHGVLEQCLVYYICVQPCITILISYSHNKAYNDSLLFVHIPHMLSQRFLLVDFAQPWLSNSIYCNKYMSKYSG